MKLYSSLLALGVIAPAAAFNVQTTKTRSGALYSASRAKGGDGPAMAKVSLVERSGVLFT
jgi:hypothetical protein